MKIFFRYIGLIIGLSIATQSLAQKSSTPNVILIVTDDQGYGDIAVHGNPVISTPHIDQLYHESSRLTNFHVNPTCAPTRAALMTGKYANRVGVWHTVMGRSILYEQEQTIADVFSNNGYATAMFGKWHLGDNYPYAPQYRGFQEVLTHGGGGVGQTPDHWNNDYFNDVYLRNGKPEQTKGYCTDVWFREALSFIKKNKDKPFFCYIATNAPHSPLNVPVDYVAPYLNKGVPHNRAKFYGMISNIDYNLGKLREQLEEWNIADNTILIFMSDNGTAYGASYKGTELVNGYNAQMRGTKGSPYEGGHRVPFYIYWKDGNISTGRDMDDLTAHIDVLPTLIKLCGLKAGKKIAFDGTDLSESLIGKKKVQDRILIGDSQRIEYPEKWRQSYTMTKDWRMINGKELYNIKEDPEQLHDVAAQHPQLMEKLKNAYEQNWDDQKKSFDQFPYIKLGSDEEPISVLTAHDWHVEKGQKVPWNHEMVRKGVDGNGEWRVNFIRAGKYKISLRRWPVEADLALNASAEKLVTEAPDYILPQGKVYQFNKSFVKIGDRSWEQTVDKAAKEVSFTLEVEEGETVMSAYFETEDGNMQGAYYLYVEHQPTNAKRNKQSEKDTF
ncbi:arylsulfatase [Limibacter armeniacum]|uniref:arylsulfatase n=1 Tax=Limibacter armeniacum TaxID=466084 RepID=UPI002FE55125